MNRRQYWKNRIPFLLTNLICMVALTVFLLVCDISISAVLLILVVWALVLLAGLFLTYWKRDQQMRQLLGMAGQLSERYLISEVMELPEQAEDQVYYRLLKMAGKSMLEQISEVKRERLEYKEYIEQWIHEIKTPITAMKLLCENHRTDWTKELLLELEKTNRLRNKRFISPAANIPRKIILFGKWLWLKWCIRRLRTTNTCCSKMVCVWKLRQYRIRFILMKNGCDSS